MSSSRRYIRLSVLASMLGLLLGSGVQAQVSVQIGVNFTGSDNSGVGSTPADSNGDVGLNYYVEFLNGSFSVYDKSDGTSVASISDTTFWSNEGPGGGGHGITFGPSDAVSDPRVIYDPTSQRWFASQVKFNASVGDPTTQSDYYLFGVSDSDDPSGSWHVFSFLAVPGATRFSDFPTLGLDANAVYIGGDIYSAGTNSLGCALTMIPKADLLANPPVISNRIFFAPAPYTNRGAIFQPATCLDGSSSGNVLAAGSLGDDYEMHSNLVATTVLNPGLPSATLAPATNIFVPAYFAPINPTQPDGSQSLDANDARLSARTYTVGGVIYAVQNVEVGGLAAIQWYRVSAANYALLESGTITDPNMDLFFPSIAANSDGVVVIGCNGCGPTNYISAFAYAGLTAGGVTTFGPRILLAAGDSNYHDLNDQLAYLLGDTWDESRWGDYSATSVDPANPSHFWTIQMLPLYDFDYDLTGGAAAFWHMQITELITSLPAPSLAISVSNSSATISWPTSPSGYGLQSTTNLTEGVGWVPVAQTPSTNGSTAYVTLTISGPQEFFRLSQ